MNNSQKNNPVAIFLAGGAGKRMNGVVEDKILAPILGVPALIRSVQNFAKSGETETSVFVCRDNTQLAEIQILLRQADLFVPAKTFFCLGGKERRDSVLCGLRCAIENGIPASALAFIHDCARPLVSDKNLHELATTAKREGAAVLAHRCVNTVKRVPAGTLPGNACIQEDLERSRLWETETPQVFPLGKILAAYEKTIAENVPVTDDVSAFPAPVALVENTEPNPKLTVPADLLVICTILQNQQNSSLQA